MPTPPPTRKPTPTKLTRRRPAVLVAALVGVVVFAVSFLTGHSETLAIGAFLALGCGFVYMTTKPVPPPPR